MRHWNKFPSEALDAPLLEVLKIGWTGQSFEQLGLVKLFLSVAGEFRTI